MARRAKNRTVGGAPLLLRLPAEMRADAEREAEAAGLGLSEWIRMAMGRELHARGYERAMAALKKRPAPRKNSAPTPPQG